MVESNEVFVVPQIQRSSTFPLLRPFNAVLHAVATPHHTIILVATS